MVTLLIAVVTFSKSDLTVYEGLVPTANREWLGLVLKAFAASAFAAVVLGYIALTVIRIFPVFCIHAAMILNMVILLVVAILVGIKVSPIAAIVVGIFLVLWGFIYFSMLPFIPFLAELLIAVTGLIMKYPSTIVLNVVSVVLQFLWLMLYSYVTLQLQARYGRGGVIALTIYMLLSLFWTMQMIKNLVHTTNCGVFATWYFMNHTTDMPTSPMMGALKRSCTTSFGSIAFGSLIVAVIQTLRTLANIRARESNPDNACGVVMCVCATIAGCILNVLEQIAIYFNHYAFVVVATYGQSFVEAGKTTFAMFQRTAMLNLLNDNMLDRLQIAVCTLNSLIIMMCSAGFAYWVGLKPAYITLVTACCFFSAFIITSLIFQTVESAAATLYVCFAEDSNALARSNPSLYARIMSTFGANIVASDPHVQTV